VVLKSARPEVVLEPPPTWQDLLPVDVNMWLKDDEGPGSFISLFNRGRVPSEVWKRVQVEQEGASLSLILLHTASGPSFSWPPCTRSDTDHLCVPPQTRAGDGTATSDDPTAGKNFHCVPYNPLATSRKKQAFRIKYRMHEIEMEIIETPTGKRKRGQAEHRALHHVVKLEEVMRGRSLMHNLALYRTILSELQGSDHEPDREKGQQLQARVEPLIERAMRAAERADMVGGPDGDSQVTGQGSASDLQAVPPSSTDGWGEVEIRNANREIVLALGETMHGAVWRPSGGHDAATGLSDQAAKKSRLPGAY
jgi:hypothetical protein